MHPSVHSSIRLLFRSFVRVETMSLVKWKDSWVDSSTIQEVDQSSGIDSLIDAAQQYADESN
jgi:hypothetical protein